MHWLKVIYDRTLYSAYLVLKQHLLWQQNVRIPEPTELMEDEVGVNEYLRAMDTAQGGYTT